MSSDLQHPIRVLYFSIGQLRFAKICLWHPNSTAITVMKYLVIIQQFIIIFSNYSVFVFAFQVLQFCDQNIASRSLRPERSRQRFKSILHAIVKQNLSILKELPILVSQVKSSNKIFLVKWAIPGLFYLNTVDSKRSIFFLPMTGFELQTTVVRTYCSTNWTTTPAQ